jgi:hypothetical protein
MADISSSTVYRQRAEECLQLAITARDADLRATLMDLAADFEKTAESLEANSAHPRHRRTAA